MENGEWVLETGWQGGSLGGGDTEWGTGWWRGNTGRSWAEETALQRDVNVDIQGREKLVRLQQREGEWQSTSGQGGRPMLKD